LALQRITVVKSEKLPMSSWRELLDFRFANAAQNPPILCHMVHYSYLVDMSKLNEDLAGARALALWLQRLFAWRVRAHGWTVLQQQRIRRETRIVEE